MKSRTARNSLIFVGLALAVASVFRVARAADRVVVLPAPAFDAPLAKTAGQETAVISGGCFWGIQAVFQHVKGVKTAVSGYSGGEEITADYEMVSSGTTGHAESVQITYDPSQISYGRLLQVFFSVAHDPTQLNRQGPDQGSQYRSAIFYRGDLQKRIAEVYVTQLQQAKVFPRPIVTEIASLKAFYRAEDYHQNYATLHPHDPYIVINDAPKVVHLQEQFPSLYVNR